MAGTVSSKDDQLEPAQLAEMCRALGSPTRLRMIQILKQKERYCGDLVKLFDLSQSTVSHHLKALRDADLIQAEERGAATCYRINHARLEAFKEQLRNSL